MNHGDMEMTDTAQMHSMGEQAMDAAMDATMDATMGSMMGRSEQDVEMTPYAFRTSMQMTHELAVEQVKSALAEQGYGVLTEIDMRKTLQTKLGADFRNYSILGACNPPLALEALTAELDVGLLLPCNVLVYDNGDGSCTVSIIDPLTMMDVAHNPDLAPVANEAQARLLRVIDTLAQPTR